MLFGADQIGRDMLTRLIYGARMTIGIAAATTVVSFFIGVTLGFTAAVVGSWADLVLSRLVDVIMSIPQLILALIILGVFGSSIPVLILTIALLDSTRVFRLSRALGMNLAVLEFVEVARMRGEGLWWVIRAEILPNAAAPLISEFGLRFCFQLPVRRGAELSLASACNRPMQIGAAWCARMRRRSISACLRPFIPQLRSRR